MNPNDLYIDDELAGLLTPHTEVELGHLEESLRADGLLTPLLVWPTEGRRILLDGFARYRLATRLKLAIRCTEVPLPDRDAAVEFRLKQQLARRNLPPIAQAYLRGRLYLLTEKRQGARTDLPKGKADARLTARGVAERFNCSERTIRRDQRLAKVIDQIGQPEQQGPEFKALLLAGKSNLTRQGVFRLARMGQAEQQRVLARLEQESEERRTRPRRRPSATPKSATSTSNSGADSAVDRQEAESPGAVSATQMPAPTPRYDSLPTDAKYTATAACRLANPTPAGPAVDTEPADEGVLEKMTALWRKANHATRILFLRQPVVQIAIVRLNFSKARK